MQEKIEQVKIALSEISVNIDTLLTNEDVKNVVDIIQTNQTTKNLLINYNITTEELQFILNTIQDQNYIKGVLESLCITKEELQNAWKYSLKDQLVFENDKYKFSIVLKFSNTVDIFSLLTNNLKQITNAITEIQVSKNENQKKVFINTLISLVPLLCEILTSSKMQQIFLQIIKGNKVVEKKENENIVLSIEQVSKLTIDDILIDDFALYTKISIILVIIAIKSFFFKNTSKIILS